MFTRLYHLFIKILYFIFFLTLIYHRVLDEAGGEMQPVSYGNKLLLLLLLLMRLVVLPH